MNRLKHCEQMLEMICDHLGIDHDVEGKMVELFHLKETDRLSEARSTWKRALLKTLKEMDCDYLGIVTTEDDDLKFSHSIPAGCFKMKPNRETCAWEVLDLQTRLRSRNQKLNVVQCFAGANATLDQVAEYLLQRVIRGSLKFLNYPLERKLVVTLRERIRGLFGMRDKLPPDTDRGGEVSFTTSEGILEFENGNVLNVYDDRVKTYTTGFSMIIPPKRDEIPEYVSFVTELDRKSVRVDDDLINSIEKWLITEQCTCYKLPLEATL